MHNTLTCTKMRVIPLLLLTTFATTAALADVALRDTVVTATRSAAQVDELPVTVTAVTREDMDRRIPMDEAELFRDDPDVAMARDLRRFGATRLNIRGLEGSRVVTMVDGVRLPDYYNGGGPTNFTMSATPSAFPDFLKQVEIVRGAASSLYGSDALGGVVGFVTLEPSDIARGEQRSAVRLRGGYGSANDQYSSSLVGALRGEGLELLLGYGEAHGHESRNQGQNEAMGPARDKPNAATTVDRGLLAKLIVRPGVGHKLTAAIESREQEVETDVKRISSTLSKVSRMLGDDQNRRTRYSLEYEHKPTGMFYDRMLAKFYFQDSKTQNANYQRRSNTSAGCSAAATGTSNCDVYQDFRFDQQNTGLNVQFESLMGRDVTHLLTYGVDLMQQKVEEFRDTTAYNRTTGSVLKALAGDSYPLRDFPMGSTDSVGLFVQDEISGLSHGKLTLTPGVRYDYTKLEPEIDPLVQTVLTAVGRNVQSHSYSHLSPKLGAQWKFDEVFSTFGQIAAGFRAPNYNEVNGAFRNTTQLYATVPNGALKPETSIGVEVGLRAKTATARGQVVVYENNYENFIESIYLNCTANPLCVTGYRTSQSVNIPKVRIYGAEARGSWDFSPGWRLDGAVAYAYGQDQTNHQPLNSIEPLRLSLGLLRDAGAWGAEGRVRAAVGKKRIDDTYVTTSGTLTVDPYFRTPGYGVADLAAWFKPTRDTRITVAVNNLFDQKYWLWSDIRQADARNPAGVDFYTQPGRNFRLSFQADF